MKKILVITMVLAVVAAMVVPLTVGATADGSPKSGNTEIDASISPNIELNQPSNFTLGTSGVMVVGTNSGNDSHGWVSCNDRGGYDVTVIDQNTGTGTGHMISSGVSLIAPLKVLLAGGSTFATVDSAATIESQTSTEYQKGFTLSAQQVVGDTDASGNYRIILIVTATAK